MNSTDDVRMPYFQGEFPPEEFAARRQRIAETIGPNAVAVLRGSPANGAFEVFRQFNEFYYLCGVETPHAYLLIDGQTAKCKLYLPNHDEKLEHMDGPQLNCDVPDVACRLTGVDAVRPLRQLASDLQDVHQIFMTFAGSEGRQACQDTLRHARKEMAADPWGDCESPEQRFARRIAATCPAATIHDLSPILNRLRLIKSNRELALMRRAGQLTAEAVKVAMTTSRPGMFEYQLTAIADGIYRDGGAQGAGYAAIMACGANIWNGHYNRNNCKLLDGELVLMDYAPDLGYYTSDIGRLWPVSGTFLPWQRELYGFVVEYHKTLLRLIRPGAMAAQIMDEAAAAMEPVIATTRWSKPVFREAAVAMLTFRGHLSHPVGMAVHDVGSYQNESFKPGLVFALDPQLWVPSEELYIRVEDTIAVTEHGVEVLTAGAPFEIAEIESLLNRR